MLLLKSLSKDIIFCDYKSIQWVVKGQVIPKKKKKGQFLVSSKKENFILVTFY